MAIPTMTLPMTSQKTVGARAVPTAPKAKRAAVTISTMRRPNRSVSVPPAAAPSTAPNTTELTTISSTVGEREKSCWMKRIAPDMTPVS